MEDPQGTSQQIETTDEHPFWVPETNTWVAAADLRIGQNVQTTTGQRLTVSSSLREDHPTGIDVYNFEVEDFHTYFVAAPGTSATHAVLVHNTCNGPLYRVLRPTENIDIGLSAKNPLAKYSLEAHVSQGNKLSTQYISATSKYDVALHWSNKTGNRVVEIDVSQLSNVQVIDVSTRHNAIQHLKHPIYINFATNSSEVILEGWVPPSALKIAYTPEN